MPQLDGYQNKGSVYDICFFGSLTQYRRERIVRLKHLGLNIRILANVAPLVRDETLRVSKINLSLLANDTSMTHLPHFRVLTGLYHNTMTVSESARTQDWIQPMVKMVDGGVDDLIATIMDLLETGSYTTLAQEYREQFVAMPMKDIMQEMLVDL